MNIEEIKTKTRELLGLSEDADLSYITEDELKSFKEISTEGVDKNDVPKTVFGRLHSFGYVGNVAVYNIIGGTGTANGWATRKEDACLDGRYWVTQHQWHFSPAGHTCSGGNYPAFQRVDKFTQR